MECVNCGKDYQAIQKFCTSCGSSVQVDSDRIGSHSPEGLLEELRSISFSIRTLASFVRSGDTVAIDITERLRFRRESLLKKFNEVASEAYVSTTPIHLSYLENVLRASGLSDLEIDSYISQELEPVSQSKDQKTLEHRGGYSISNNLLPALLLLGVLLLAASSLVLLVTLWSDFSWIVKQIILLVQMVSFIAAGHFMKYKQKLHYSGLALVTLGAVWGLFNAGAIAYEFIGTRGEIIVPGIALAIDLPAHGWILISSVSFFIWIVLSSFYKGHVLINGTAIFFVASMGLLPSVLGTTWHWGLGSAALASSLVTFFSTMSLRFGIGIGKAGDYLFWTSQIILPVTFFVFLQEWTDDRISLYCSSIIFIAAALTSVVVVKLKPSGEFAFYRYGCVTSFVLALGSFVFESGLVQGEWFGVFIALTALGCAVLMILVSRRELVSSDWSITLGYCTLALSVIASLWPEFSQFSKGATLLLAGGSLWVSAFELSNKKLLLFTGMPIAIGGLLLIDLLLEGQNLDNYELAWSVFGIALAGQLGSFVGLRVAEKFFLPLLSASVAFSLAAVTISGWGDWANWEGLFMCITFFCICVFLIRIRQQKIIGVAVLFWLTAAGGFAMGMMGLSFVERSVGWAIESLLLMWLNQSIAHIGVLRKLFSNRFWNGLIEQASLRLSWFALGYVILVLVGGSFDSDTFGNSNISMLAITFSIVGVSYVGTSIMKKSHTLAYVGFVLLLFGWIVQAIDWRIGQAQIYAIPVGLYLFGVAHWERLKLSPQKYQDAYFIDQTSTENENGVMWSPFVEVLALLLVGGSAFIQSVTQKPEWVYALLLGIEGVLILIWGSVSRSRILFVGGVLIFAINVIYQLTSLLSHLGGAMVGVIFGSLIIVLVVLAERFRGKLSLLVDRFTKN